MFWREYAPVGLSDMQVVVTDEAMANLRAIWSFYQDKNLTYADRTVEGLLNFCVGTLSSFSNLGTIYRPADAVRRIVHGDYNIYYKTDGERVFVLHILHHRQMMNDLLRDRDV